MYNKSLNIVIMVKAALFDMDGVLIDSVDLWLDRLQSKLNEIGFTASRKEIGVLIGKQVIDILRTITKGNVSDVDLRRYQEEIYEETQESFFEKVKLTPGIDKLLVDMKSQGIFTCICSSTERSVIEKIIQKFSLADCFNGVIGAEDVVKGKPDPEVFIKGADKVNCLPQDCIVLEDAKLGIEAAKRAGCKTVFLPNRYVRDQIHLVNSDIVLTKIGPDTLQQILQLS